MHCVTRREASTLVLQLPAAPDFDLCLLAPPQHSSLYFVYGQDVLVTGSIAHGA